MADSHGHDAGHGNLFQLYMIIAVILSICTALSFVFNQFVPDKFAAFLLILTVAIIKATLVGLYFMHLKWDWKLLYFIIITAFIMGTMMTVVLLPDTLLGPNKDMKEGYEIAKKVQP